MGGEWGVGASLTMESDSAACPRLRLRPAAIGLPDRLFLASIVYGLLFQYIGWRGMFMVGVHPGAAGLLYPPQRSGIAELETDDRRRSNTLAVLKSHWRLGIYAVLLMTAFNFFSHGTQDLYPTFLQVQHGFVRTRSA